MNNGLGDRCVCVFLDSYMYVFVAQCDFNRFLVDNVKVCVV